VISEINRGEGCGEWLATPVRLEKQEDTLTITINFLDGPDIIGRKAEKHYADYVPEVWQQVIGEKIKARFQVAPRTSLNLLDEDLGIVGALERFEESLNAGN